MTLVLAVLVGALFATGVFLILRRHAVTLLLGLVLLAHAANLFVFASGGVTRGGTPIVPEGSSRLPASAADPLPQALVLTAIVISFGVLAFVIALLERHHRLAGTEEVDRLTGGED